jgi:predicted SAM-dependent methyltransferase
MMIENCRICGSKLAHRYTSREMMFGMKDLFTYGECPDCGAVQILEVPRDISRYYPPHYMAFSQHVPPLNTHTLVDKLTAPIRLKYKYLVRSNHYVTDYLRPLGTMPKARILDIGSGNGALLCALYNRGFMNVSGVDKFIPEELDYGRGVKIYKKELEELESKAYDLLIMNHVLEHVDNQVEELQQCNRLLSSGGAMMINVPVLGAAWEEYRENWVQLDAPRHFVLHTLKSMNVLAEKTGFVVDKVVFDSTAFQFWGSELYARDIPLTDPDDFSWRNQWEIFGKAQIEQYEAAALALNAKRAGAARFYLRKRK